MDAIREWRREGRGAKRRLNLEKSTRVFSCMGESKSIEHHDVETLNLVLARRGSAYLFIGRGAAVLHGFPDTTQDVDIFPRKDATNTRAQKRAAMHVTTEDDEAARNAFAILASMPDPTAQERCGGLPRHAASRRPAEGKGRLADPRGTQWRRQTPDERER